MSLGALLGDIPENGSQCGAQTTSALPAACSGKVGSVGGKHLLGNGDPLWLCWGQGTPRELHPGCSRQGTAERLCVPVAVSVFLLWIRVPDRNDLLLFPGVQTGKKQVAPN